MKLWRHRARAQRRQGHDLNISLIAFRAEDYVRLVRHVTAARVRDASPVWSPARCADTSFRPSRR